WTKQELEVMEYWEMRERADQDKRQAAYDKGKKMGEKRGEKKGEKKGRFAEKQEIARNMLAKGIEPAIVVETTGLSSADLTAL
ncbi:hypothetical protein PN36_32770, partial [Candidatus Thiomargarita nelsonii]